MENLTEIIRNNLRVKSKTTIDALIHAILCVACGLRSCHLIDVTYVSADTSRRLLSVLRQHPTGEHLLLLQFKDRYTFLCNKLRLEQHVKSTIESPQQWIYYDVRGKGSPPSKTRCPEVLLLWLHHRLTPFLESTQIYYYQETVPSYMVALTGWALEYPVIYQTHDPDEATLDLELDEWEVRPNCLGSIRLNVVRVWLRFHINSADYLIASFSYPDDPAQVDLAALQEKFQQRLIEAKKKSKHFEKASIQLTTEQVTMDTVAL